MCEALARAENAKALPCIEGELPDMPEGEVDEDFEETPKSRRKNKAKAKKGSKHAAD